MIVIGVLTPKKFAEEFLKEAESICVLRSHFRDRSSASERVGGSKGGKKQWVRKGEWLNWHVLVLLLSHHYTGYK